MSSRIVEGVVRYEPDSTLPNLCVRGNEGFYLYSTVSEVNQKPPVEPYQLDANVAQKSSNQVFAWSADGKYMAWCNSQNLLVLDVYADFAVQLQVDKSRVISIEFSPNNTYISTFEPFSNANNNKDNIGIYSLLGGHLVAKFTQGTFAHWQPQFSCDERICCRFFKDHALFFQDGDFSQPKYKLHIPGLALVHMFPSAPNHVAIYIGRSKKGAPNVVKVLRYPDLNENQPMSTKRLMVGDKATLHWNWNGTALIVKNMEEVDTSGNEYYGKTTLFYVSTEGSANKVELKKEGPIYEISWDPGRNEFCVVYGHMPSKASLFNSNCDSVYDFGTGLRSACRFSPQGHLLALYGHGSVRSNVEIWHRASLSLVAKIVDFADITMFDWSPCGERILLATHSPTLKVDNKWAIYNYMGKSLMCSGVKPRGSTCELWQVGWQNRRKEQFPPRQINFTALSLQDLKVQEATESKYVPPYMRNKASQEINQKKNIVLDLNDLPDRERAAAMAMNGSSSGGAYNITYRSGGDSSQAGRGLGSAAPSRSYVPGAAPMGDSGGASSEKSKKNRIKTLEKRLKEMGTLKKKQKSGETLEKEAIEKISREDEVRAELNKLKQELGLGGNPSATTAANGV